MAEVLGVCSAIISLFPICMDGYDAIVGCCRATKDLEVEAKRVYIQQGVLLQWGETWGVVGDVRHGRSSKLERHLEGGSRVGSHVLMTLLAISDTFADVERLQGEYGISHTSVESAAKEVPLNHVLQHFKKSDPSSIEKAKKLEVNLSLFRKCKFALRDKKKFAGLIELLKEFNGNLRDICPRQESEVMDRGLLHVLVEDNNQQSLRVLGRVSRAESQTSAVQGRSQAGYDLLAAAADFKSKVVDRTPYWSTQPLTKSTYDIPSKHDSGKWALGIDYGNQLVVFIEWKHYSNKDEEALGVPSESSVHELEKLFCVGNVPSEFRALVCFGMFKDLQQSRYGFVYALPAMLGSFIQLGQGALTARKPISLAEILQSHPMLELGLRFRLAQRLAHSVYMIHSSGWLHKHIRPESIFFFPRHANPSHFSSAQPQVDLERPFLMGYGSSRPDFGAFRPTAENYALRPRNQSSITSLESIYQHPEKWHSPLLRSRRSFDLYALGCVLLEIGVWRSLGDLLPRVQMHGITNAEQLNEYMVTIASSELGQACGAIYASAVKECLQIVPTDVEDEGSRLASWSIVTKLDQCVA